MGIYGRSIIDQGDFVVGCNYWASHAGTRMWTDWQPEIIDKDLKLLADEGVQVLRVFPLWPDFQPITMLYGGGGSPYEVRHGESLFPDNDAGRAGVSEEAMARFAEFVRIAEKHGLRLVVGLITGWMSGRLFVPPALEGKNILTDPLAIMWQVRFVRHFVSSFLDSAAIIAWDLGNECNCMGSVPNRESAYVWTASIVNAIRAVDNSRTVVSGMHGLEVDGKWAIEDHGELTDLLTTHPYPVFTPHCDQDPINTMRSCLHATAESRLYADISGKPCIAEELGTLGPMIASENIAADYIRTCLFSLWAHDCHGLLWWGAHDQELLEHAPYDWWMVERELGLVRSNGTVKPVLKELGKFSSILERMPFDKLPKRMTDAVCILSHTHDSWGVAFSSFVLAKQAGFDIEFQDGKQPLKESNVYLLPSIQGMNSMSRHRWLELLERVNQGATLYISMGNALVSHFTEFTGLVVDTRERRTSPAVITFPCIDGLSDITLDSEFKLTLTPLDAKVIGCESDGNPAFTCVQRGKGKVYLLTSPLEANLANQPGAFRPDGPEYWRLLQYVMKDIQSNRIVHKTIPQVGITEHPIDDDHRIVIAINYSPESLETTLSLSKGWELSNVLYGNSSGSKVNGILCNIPGNDAVVTAIDRSSTD
ncbi:MAG: glycoside hydrolase 5 family protein [Armatimonadota bacterium]